MQSSPAERLRVVSSHLSAALRTHRILVCPGDGIGVDTIAEGCKCLRAAERACGGAFALAMREVDWGVRHWERTGAVAPSGLVEEVRATCDAVYLGALGDPRRLPDHVTLAPLVTMRQRLDQYICLRPNVLFKGVPRPLASDKPVDIVVVRENSEGEYSKVGGAVRPGTAAEAAYEVAVHTRAAVDRCCRYAFELARSRRRHVTLATKSNALRHGMVLWDEVFAEVARAFPDVSVSRMHVDALAADLVRRPHTFDVIVASNLFGDILSDLAGAVVGGLGMSPSANINPERKFPSMFEPVHGSAPDIAGKGIANPVGAILAGAMMLNFLGETRAARLIERAVAEGLESGPRTPDVGGTATTTQVGDDVASRIARLAKDA